MGDVVQKCYNQKTKLGDESEGVDVVINADNEANEDETERTVARERTFKECVPVHKREQCDGGRQRRGDRRICNVKAMSVGVPNDRSSADKMWQGKGELLRRRINEDKHECELNS